MKFIFVDTFALEQLTRNHFDLLDNYLAKSKLRIVISPLQLIEYYSPIIQQGDRTHKAVQLLTKHPFVIVNQSNIYNSEEELYPAIVNELPYQLDSEKVMQNLNADQRAIILFQMLHAGIPGGDFDLKKWTADHNQTKANWPEHAAAIIDHAEANYLIKSKDKFIESQDLRFCDQILKAITQLENPPSFDVAFKRSLDKLIGMRKRKDTWRMRGIHLCSLIFWYDYIIAKKKIKPSDEGDLMHSMIFPYCSVVITDNSRIDCLGTIQKKENKYKDVSFYKIKDFIALLNN
jgi:hypothetical protein